MAETSGAGAATAAAVPMTAARLESAAQNPLRLETITRVADIMHSMRVCNGGGSIVPATLHIDKEIRCMKREIIRVEPLSTYLERWKAPTSAVTRAGDTIYVSGFPPFDPETGEVVDAPIERQTELVLEQLKLCVETAGSSLDKVLKCNVYCTSADKFAAVNAIYARYFPDNPPARIFVCVPQWFGRFDIEIDCIAAL